MKILVAYDGSPQSKESLALLYQKRLFKSYKIKLVYACATVTDELEEYPDVEPEVFASYNYELKKEAEDILYEARTHLASQGLECETLVLEGGAASALIKHISQEGYDLAILGSRGLTPLKSFVLGSVSDSVMHYAPSSTLIYRPQEHKTQSNAKVEKGLHVVLGYDDTEAAEKAIDFIKHFDCAHIGAIELVTTIPLNIATEMSSLANVLTPFDDYKKSAIHRLAQQVQSLQKEHPKIHFSYSIINDSRDTATDLIEFCQRTKADMIMVGSNEKSAFDRIIIGSVSSKLAHRAGLPVLVIK